MVRAFGGQNKKIKKRPGMSCGEIGFRYIRWMGSAVNTLGRLNTHMRGSRLLYSASWIAVALAAFFGLLQPQVLRVVLDVGLGGREWTGARWAGFIIEGIGGSDGIRGMLLPAAGVSVLLMGFSGLFLYLKGRWSATAAEETARRMRDRLYTHLQNLDFDYHVRANTGDLIQRCTSDVETIRSFLAAQAVEIGRAVFLVIFTASMMWGLNPKLTAISMAVMPLLVIFGYVFFVKVKHVFGESDESEGRMSAMLQENIRGIRVVRAFARRDYEIAKFDEKNRDYRDKTYRVIRLLAWYWSVSDIMAFAQIGLVMAAGSWWAVTGRISLGETVLFFAFVGRLLWPVRELGRILTEMGKAAVSLRRVQEILDEPLEVETGDHRGVVGGRVEFRNVHFSYDDGRAILRGLDFEVNPGEIVAVLGPTGSGKSTMAQLLPRLYDPCDGEILIDGKSTVEWDRRTLREQVCIILQEPFLFNRTLKENITLATTEADENSIADSARAAALHEVIAGFEKGYDTVVGEGGVTLSGGQKQRMALARTLIRNPRVIIMDDSLSAVDAETDASIRMRLRERFGSATVFIIAHRMSTLQEADRILVLEDGRITQQGRHHDLVAEHGLYRRIWRIQNAGAEDEAG